MLLTNHIARAWNRYWAVKNFATNFTTQIRFDTHFSFYLNKLLAKLWSIFKINIKFDVNKNFGLKQVLKITNTIKKNFLA
jgi:hypothetical protein